MNCHSAASCFVPAAFVVLPVASSYKDLMALPPDVRRRFGYALSLFQNPVFIHFGIDEMSGICWRRR
jgi:hypothetical protein